MSILEKYNETLDLRAGEERERAAEAKAKGDERRHSVHLMQASMLGDMLKVLGKVQHEGARPGVLQAQIDSLKREEEKQKACGDYDNADRARVKAETIAWAQNVLAELEHAHE